MAASPKEDKKAEGRQVSQRLKHVRKTLLNMTQDQFCEKSEIPKQTYAVWENVRFSGLTSSGADRVLKHYRALGVACTKPWLLHGVGAPPSMKGDVSNHTTAWLEDIAEELLVFTKKGESLDYYVTHDAMTPTYEQGDTVAGYVESIEKANGKNCIILFDNNGSHHKTIGRVNLHDQALAVSYLNVNIPAKTIETEKIVSISPIIWHRKPKI